MELQKVNASLQRFVPRCEAVIHYPLLFFVFWLSTNSSLGFWVFALYFAFLAVSTSFHSSETRLMRIKAFALVLFYAAIIYPLMKFMPLYGSVLIPFAPIIAIGGFFIALFVCFKSYRSYFRAESIEVREIPVKSSKPTLFLNQR